MRKIVILLALTLLACTFFSLSAIAAEPEVSQEESTAVTLFSVPNLAGKSDQVKSGDVLSFLAPSQDLFLNNWTLVVPIALGVFALLLSVRLIPKVFRKIMR